MEFVPFIFAGACFFAALYGKELLSAWRNKTQDSGRDRARLLNHESREMSSCVAVKNSTALILLLTIPAQASIVTEPFLDRLAYIESRNRVNVVGDRGTALGPFQMRVGAWTDVNRIAGTSIPFTMATNPVIARKFARDYLLILEPLVTASLHKSPTKAQLYCAWNLGLEGFQRRGFSIKRCPLATRLAAAKL